MKIIKIKSADAVEVVLKIIKEGGVVVCPTDTVYGFLADATNKIAVEKIYKIKIYKKTKSPKVKNTKSSTHSQAMINY